MRLFKPNARLCRWVEIVWPASKSKHATTFPSLVLLIHPPIQISSNHPLHVYTKTSKEIHLDWTFTSFFLSLPFFLLFYFSFLPSFLLHPFLFSFHPSTLVRVLGNHGPSTLRWYINVPVANKTRTRGSKITLSSTGRNDLYWFPRPSSEQISRNGGRSCLGRWGLRGSLIFHRFFHGQWRIVLKNNLADFTRCDSYIQFLSFFFLIFSGSRL